MNPANHDLHNGRSIGAILFDTKEELIEFVETRLSMLWIELCENLRALRAVAPLAVVGITMLLTAYMLFTLALVGLAVAFMPANPYRWAVAFAAVAVLWTISGGIAAYFARRKFNMSALMPTRTMRVLKEDSIWIDREVRSHT